MIEGILFDMDGVLIDSEPIILRAAHAFFARRGITTREEDFQPFVGAGDRRYLEGVGERYGLTLDFDRDRTELYELYAQAVQEAGMRPVPAQEFPVDPRRFPPTAERLEAPGSP